MALFYFTHFFTYALALASSLVLLNQEEQVLWHAFVILNSLFLLSEFGTGPVIARLTSYVTEGATTLSYNIKEVQSSVGSGKLDKITFDKLITLTNRFVVRLSVLVLAGFIIFTTYYFETLSPGFLVEKNDVFFALIILLISLPFSVSARKYHALLMGLGYQKQVFLWNAAFTILTAALYLAAIYNSAGLVHLIFIAQCVHLLSFLRNRHLFRRIYFEKFAGEKYKKTNGADYFEALWAPSWRGFLGIFGSIGIQHIINLMVALYLPATAVAPYLFTIRLITIAEQGSNVFLMARIPRINSARARGDLLALRKSTTEIVRLVLATYPLLCLLFFFIAASVFPILSPGATILPFEMLFLLVFFGILARHHSLHTHIFSSVNQEPFYKPIVATGLLNILILSVTLESLGIWGLILAGGLANLVFMNWWCVMISLKSLDFMPSQYLFQVLNFSKTADVR